jgi:hypothetical protein
MTVACGDSDAAACKAAKKETISWAIDDFESETKSMIETKLIANWEPTDTT